MKRNHNPNKNTKNKRKKFKNDCVSNVLQCTAPLPLVLCQIIESFCIFPNNTIFSAISHRSKYLMAVKSSKWTNKLGLRYNIHEIASLDRCFQFNVIGLDIATILRMSLDHTPIRPLVFLRHRAYAKEIDGKLLCSCNRYRLSPYLEEM